MCKVMKALLTLVKHGHTFQYVYYIEIKII